MCSNDCTFKIGCTHSCLKLQNMEICEHLFFYPAICHVCKTSTCGEALKRCGGCKMIAYCNTEHQKKHWPSHKSVCKTIQHLLSKNSMESIFQDADENTSSNEWCDIRIKSVILMELLLSRKLQLDEWQMFIFPRVCEVCKELQTTQLIDCEECLCVSYCSMVHQETDSVHHSSVCSQLKLCREADTYFLNNKQPYPLFCTAVQEHSCTLPCDIETFISEYVDMKSSTKVVSYMDNILCSEYLTCPLTLLYAFEISNFKITSDNIIIHIVGASRLEGGFPLIWESLLHWLSQVTTIHVIFIGPDVSVVEEQQYYVCKNCKERNRQLNLYHFKMFYHSFVESEFFLTPDVIIAYNCGLHENESADSDPWEKSLPFMMMFKSVPVILTSYTKLEAEKDLLRIVSKCKNADILLQCKRNPFASRRPYRDWAGSRLKVFYQNNFISVLKSPN